MGIVFLVGTEANALFIVDTDPGGQAINLANAKDSLSSTAMAGSDSINVGTNVASDFSSGNATIKPAGDDPLYTVTFTPENATLFGDFSFRGQLSEAGSVTVTVQDNQNNPEQFFTFGPFAANTNFTRIGIISTDNETIKWVSVTSSGWKESKLFEFSLNTNNGTPLPEPTTMLLLGLGLVGLAGARRFRK